MLETATTQVTSLNTEGLNPESLFLSHLGKRSGSRDLVLETISRGSRHFNQAAAYR
jgi:hypothetical protein